MNHRPPKKSLKQKLAVALSVVNALNVCAPMALPYVNVAKNVRADGGQAEPLSDGLARAFYGTAEAEAQPTEYTSVLQGGTQTRETVESGGWQDISGSNSSGTPGGVGIITNLNNGGRQVVNGAISAGCSGGTGIVTNMNSGGSQVVSGGNGNGGNGTITTMNGGSQTVSGGATGSITTMNDGTQVVERDINSGTGTVASMSGGVQIVFGNGTVTSMFGGTQEVIFKGNGTITSMFGGTQNIGHVESDGTVRQGGTGTVASMSGGTQIIVGTGNEPASGAVTSMFDGTQIVSNGGTGEITNFNGGTQIVNGGTVKSISVNNGATQIINSGTVSTTTLSAGGVQIINGGTIDSITFMGGTQIYNSGNFGGTIANGVQFIQNSATAAGGAIGNGGTQIVQSGGVVTSVTISGGAQNNGGVQEVLSGGVSEHIALEGGTLVVGDYARAQIDESNGGVLRLLDLGLAEAQFGALANQATVTYNLTTLYARGDNVRLGLGDDSNHSVANKTLHIVNMDGYANFIVNTDLRNNQSDLIEIETAANATKPNTVQINHDPTLAKGEEVTSTSATVATVENGTATFVGVKSTINSIDYLPEIETIDGGRTWVIRRVMKTANDAAHSAVMGAEAGMAALAAGNDFIGAATEGLSLASNIGADGVSSFAQMGGGAVRQETGSHVDVKTWNAILALGHANKKECGTFEYGAFFEYGSGNYTTHNGDERGDGSVRSTGGGLLAKWTAAHGLYVEGSLRAGTVHDDARSVLRDNAGNAYGYETNAGYWGTHLGVGKEIPLANGNTLDVYGKFFYNRRNSVGFTVNNVPYDLDAVTSQVLRIGARYTVRREKWNFYGGLAYEHEMDGKATGTVDGLEIRGADTSGGSFRAELGATMQPNKDSPWKLDLNVAGFAGKKQGFSGGVAVTFMF